MHSSCVLGRTGYDIFTLCMFCVVVTQLLRSFHRYSARAMWKAVECRNRRLFDVWDDYVHGRPPVSARLRSFRSQNTKRTIVVLACKYAKVVGQSTDKLQRLDPDILRLDSLNDRV